MTPRATGRTPAWFYRLLVVYTGLHLILGGALMADLITHPWAPDPLSGSPAVRLLLGLGLAPAGLIVSALVLRRAPGNLSGLCLLLHSVLVLSATLRAGSPLAPFNKVLNTAWSGLWLLPLFFPDGRPQPARFGRWVVGLAALSVVSNAANAALFNSHLEVEVGWLVPNPFFVAPLGPWAAAASRLQQLVLLAVGLLVPPSLVVRYRSGDARSRQQLKWLLWPFVLFVLAVVPLWIAALAAGGSDPFAAFGRLPTLAIALFIYEFPIVAVGNAILRHRLYDIDLIIRRTLIYSVLSALLAVAYLGSVLVLQALFGQLTGNAQSPLVTVLSTLAIAGLFFPLRARVQAFIDRRFYRRKYDTARTLAAFAAAARDETDLPRLAERLVGVVDETMQPESLGLWLRKDKPA